jgi:hypothetical protein
LNRFKEKLGRMNRMRFGVRLGCQEPDMEARRPLWGRLGHPDQGVVVPSAWRVRPRERTLFRLRNITSCMNLPLSPL